VIHPADDFRGHISRRATGLFRIILFFFASNPKISDSEVSILLKDKILRFEIAMYNTFVVDILQSEDDVGSDKF